MARETIPFAADFVAPSQPHYESPALASRAACHLDEYTASPGTGLSKHSGVAVLGISIRSDRLKDAVNFQAAVLEQSRIAYERAQRVGALLG
jgi:hypothetical protein